MTFFKLFIINLYIYYDLFYYLLYIYNKKGHNKYINL